jgi:hypothetical protein
MNDLDHQVSEAFERLAQQAPHDQDLAGSVRRKARRRTRRIAGLVAAAAVVVTALAVTAEARLTRAEGGPAVTVTDSCNGSPTRAVLPSWARTGFSEPEPVMPFVRSTSGNVVAILFGNELTAPARADVGNKVLWVWKQYPADPQAVKASARLDGTGPVVTAGLPTPTGPSYVDLPTPGCWRLTLSWPGGSDTIDLQAVAPAETPSP